MALQHSSYTFTVAGKEGEARLGVCPNGSVGDDPLTRARTMETLGRTTI